MKSNYYVRITNLNDVNEIVLEQEQATTLINEGFMPVFHEIFKVNEFSYMVAVFVRYHAKEDVTSDVGTHYLSVDGIVPIQPDGM
jgi:hypothetical protein